MRHPIRRTFIRFTTLSLLALVVLIMSPNQAASLLVNIGNILLLQQHMPSVTFARIATHPLTTFTDSCPSYTDPSASARQEFFDVALKLDPTLTTAWRGLARTNLIEGACAKSITSIQKAAALSQTSQDRLWLGRILYAGGQYDQAIQTWQALSSEGVHSEQYLLSWGYHSFLQGFYDEGIKLLELSYKVRPDQNSATLLGLNLWQIGQQDRAYPWLVRAHELQTFDVIIYVRLCEYNLWNRKNPAEALMWCNLGAERFPDSSWPLTTRGMVYLAMNDREQALGDFHRATLLDQNITAYLLLARTLAQLQRWSEALEAYQITLQIDPNNATAWCELADVYWMSNQNEPAITAYQACLQIEPDYQPAKERLLNIQP